MTYKKNCVLKTYRGIVFLALISALLLFASCKKISEGGTAKSDEPEKGMCRITLVNNTVTKATIVNAEWETKDGKPQTIALGSVRYGNSYVIDLPKGEPVKIILIDEKHNRYIASAAQNGFVRIDVDYITLSFEKKTR